MESDWLGTRVRKGKRYGTVIEDSDGPYGILYVKMDDSNKKETIVMYNLGEDPPEVHAWEWQPYKEKPELWYRF